MHLTKRSVDSAIPAVSKLLTMIVMKKEALEKSSDRWGHVVSIRITFNSSEQHMVAFTSMYILYIYVDV